MRNIRPLLVVSVAASLLVSACQVADNQPAVDSSAATVVVDEQQSEQELARWKVTGNSRRDTNTAISALQLGKSVAARKLLLSATQHSRPDSRASALLKQIDTSPYILFGEIFFEYTVKSGEFLSTISKRYLDDPLLFFALARYNGIENPSKINAGMKLRIPGERPEEKPEDSNADSVVSSEQAADMIDEQVTDDVDAQVASGVDEQAADDFGEPSTEMKQTEEVESEFVSDDESPAMSTLQAFYESRKYQELLDSAEPFPEDENEIQWIEDSAMTLSLGQEREGDYEAALATINQGVGLIGARDALVDTLSLLTEKNEANMLLVDALESGSQQQQFEVLKTVEEFHPSVVMENANYSTLSGLLVDQLHKDAMLAYRQQRLAEAIVLWEKVLHLDKDNELATIHKARAENLQKKLKDIN